MIRADRRRDVPQAWNAHWFEELTGGVLRDGALRTVQRSLPLRRPEQSNVRSDKHPAEKFYCRLIVRFSCWEKEKNMERDGFK
jgi:hypothetical protein